VTSCPRSLPSQRIHSDCHRCAVSRDTLASYILSGKRILLVSARFRYTTCEGQLLLAECARKLNPEISVALVVGREVFGRKHKGTKAESAAMAWLQSHDHA
jgi:hypothetical protein